MLFDNELKILLEDANDQERILQEYKKNKEIENNEDYYLDPDNTLDELFRN